MEKPKGIAVPGKKRIPKCPGYYALLIKIQKKTIIDHPKFNKKTLDPGYYIYVGSARGPGGIAARIKRHVKKNKKKKWHIDYLTSKQDVKTILIGYKCTTKPEGEEKMSHTLEKIASPALEKFGSTDKKDETHLYKCENKKKCKETIQIALEQI